eukprot:829056-Prorocentrum_minimum.AAC.4
MPTDRRTSEVSGRGKSRGGFRPTTAPVPSRTTSNVKAKPPTKTEAKRPQTAPENRKKDNKSKSVRPPYGGPPPHTAGGRSYASSGYAITFLDCFLCDWAHPCEITFN